MSWKCKLMPVPMDQNVEAGTIVYNPDYGLDPNKSDVWWIVLPNGKMFHPDKRWTVTGILPEITLHPSIMSYACRNPETGKPVAGRCGKDYHGWLQNGVLSDDISGITY